MAAPLRLLRPAVRALRYAQSAGGVAATAARVYGVPRRAALRRARHLRASYGFAIDEALQFGLLDPASPAVPPYLSKRETLDLQRRLNPPALEPLTENKAVFAEACAVRGVPVAATLALLSRTGPAGAIPRETALHEWTQALAACRGDVVVKPVQGWHGRGVRLLSAGGGVLRREGGGAVAPPELARELWEDAEHPAWIVQPRLRNHPALAALGRPGALHTGRVVTLVGDSGEVSVLYGLLRLAVGDAVDNFRGGATGNLLTSVGANGRLEGAWGARPDRCGLTPVDVDPVSGTRLPGWAVPGWDAALAVCRAAATAFLPLRTIGWDVAITPDGPAMVEANLWWDPTPTHAVRGRLGPLLAAAAAAPPALRR
ncbi:MAG TPA: sugar-transfer associated ATP-grasp domain-containing protein [Miltoncostaeaceae bacterium]|nr:sugar-transfer associated ATP-grasp domain-containing protein [Miltoncostaeaceae bacterium]